MASEAQQRTGRLAAALKSASQTRAVEIDAGALARVPDVFRQQFGPAARAAVVADDNTFDAEGKAVVDGLARAGVKRVEPFVFHDPDLYAEHRFVERLQDALAKHDAIPVAVGAGTINDLTKLAAHRNGRPYMAVATAASMDGYTAFGASITHKGSKQTFDCPAPRAVVADLDVVAAAPTELTASGYADVLAKVTAGADWILADALGVEPIDAQAWQLVQVPLRDWLGNPVDVRAGSPDAIANLLEGLMMSGLAMQCTRSSRPASGAEHQFSHLWDMEHHTHNGEAPSHGFKVGVATAAVGRLYERLLSRDLPGELDVDACVSEWPDRDALQEQIRTLFGAGELSDKAVEESLAKWLPREALAEHLGKVRTAWPEAVRRLQAHLLSSDDIRQRLRAVGAPDASEQIGITSERLRQSHRKAYHIRRRYTVLDLAVRTRLLDALVGPA